jgi:HEAT repeat protein
VDGALTVDVRDAPLADVLRAIGAETHVDMHVSRRVATRVTGSFVAPTVEDALRRLVRGHSAVLVYAPSPDSGAARLTEVRVIDAAATAAVSAPLAPGERARRLQAIGALARRRDAAATAELTRFAEDGDAAVRRSALHGLRQAQAEGAVPTIAAALQRDADASVRRTAAHLLSMSRRPEARQALEAAASDPDASVRRSAAASLAAWHRRAGR